jgi:predicted DNA-binding transcriptional regulator AlpA
MKTRAAAAYLGMSEAWLLQKRQACDPAGPPYIRLGGAIRYLAADLDAWIESRRQASGFTCRQME